jgi:hypothetical protein
MLCEYFERRIKLQTIREKADFIHNLFEVISKDWKEVLTDCEDFDLYTFNVEAYALYSSVFGEVKIRSAKVMINRERQREEIEKFGTYEEQFTQYLMKTRFANIGLGKEGIKIE